mmetsp:Transcript_32534/g.45387  ORF Transcript_32534/g.45387 Transcript_32534/m.45387 type:complete len:274 (-) Transcript_32534:540-1361(-)
MHGCPVLCFVFDITHHTCSSTRSCCRLALCCRDLQCGIGLGPQQLHHLGSDGLCASHPSFQCCKRGCQGVHVGDHLLHHPSHYLGQGLLRSLAAPGHLGLLRRGCLPCQERVGSLGAPTSFGYRAVDPGPGAREVQGIFGLEGDWSRLRLRRRQGCCQRWTGPVEDHLAVAAEEMVPGFIEAAGMHRALVAKDSAAKLPCAKIPNSQLPVRGRGQDQVAARVDGHLSNGTSSMGSAVMLTDTIGAHIPEIDAGIPGARDDNVVAQAEASTRDA